MTTDIRKPLQSALSRLKAEKGRIDQQIEAIEGVLRMNGAQPEAVRHQVNRRKARRSMSAAARRGGESPDEGVLGEAQGCDRQTEGKGRIGNHTVESKA